MILRDSRPRERGHYATLSYCSGSRNHIQTTRANVESFHKGLNIAQLPRTFQDAIEFTRSLGLRYLWIDALCIITDDSIDKQQQCKHLGTIFRNCLVNIRVGNATNVNEGFLRKPPPAKITSVRVLVRNSPHSLERATTIAFIKAVDEPMFNWRYLEGSLDSRAWCRMESTFARRCIVFTTFNVSPKLCFNK